MDNQQTPQQPDGVNPPPGDQPVDEAQLSPQAWLVRNGPTLLFVGALVVFVGYKLGIDGLWTIAKVVFGLGLVIFVHELGHFAVAKWCDVHVQTFSIGFGPALPGCSGMRKWCSLARSGSSTCWRPVLILCTVLVSRAHL